MIVISVPEGVSTIGLLLLLSSMIFRINESFDEITLK
jgi:hypothetical protein